MIKTRLRPGNVQNGTRKVYEVTYQGFKGHWSLDKSKDEIVLQKTVANMLISKKEHFTNRTKDCHILELLL